MRKFAFMKFIEDAVIDGKTSTETFIEFGQKYREESVNLVGQEGKKNWRQSFEAVYEQIKQRRSLYLDNGPLFEQFYKHQVRRTDFVNRLLFATDDHLKKLRNEYSGTDTEDMLEAIELYNDISEAARKLDSEEGVPETCITMLLEVEGLEHFRDEAATLWPGKIAPTDD